MGEKVQLKSLKGTWNQALITFLFPIFLVFGVRWAIVEPYVIPSGSMIPNLLIHDHILVKKFAYGLSFPFSHFRLIQWGQLQRGDIVVFRFPENPDVYYIKRLIGLPGDVVEVQDGRVRINGKDLDIVAAPSSDQPEEGFYFKETLDLATYSVRFLSKQPSSDFPVEKFEVPQSEYFFMGDNRDQSSDSRVWGFVKGDLIVGKAWLIWLSCENTLSNLSFVCDPSQLRWERFFKRVL